jgi:hypothetical protein
MFRKLIFSIFLVAGISIVSVAQKADTAVYSSFMELPDEKDGHLRVSLITCGVGEELYASFGHTAIRIVDSTKGLDIAYNYGTFSFDDDFYPQFIRGKLMYYLSRETYESFISTYVDEKRSVQEQVMLLPWEKKLELYNFLEENALPENREYKYDFLFDNCATRIRDVFPNSLGKTFSFGQALPKDSKITFRDMIDHYLRNKHWERFGIDLALGSPVDSIMTNEDVMFLPDYLKDGIAGAKYNTNDQLAAPVDLLLNGSKEIEGTLNQPLVLTSILAILTILGLSIPKLRVLGKVMSYILLFITGLLGWFFLFMWLGTDHQSCQDNYNVLWALPTNLLLVFRKFKGAGKYALVAIGFIGVSLILHILKIQELPLLELVPVLLSLVFIYGMIYKRSKAAAKVQ